MNAITHTEAQALQTVTPVQPSQDMLLVPLSQLRRCRSFAAHAVTCARPQASPSTRWHRASSAWACCKT